jgi:hypothetical protein
MVLPASATDLQGEFVREVLTLIHVRLFLPFPPISFRLRFLFRLSLLFVVVLMDRLPAHSGPTLDRISCVGLVEAGAILVLRVPCL